MKKYREIELEYLEEGTFQGGDEDAFTQNFKRGEEYRLIEHQAVTDRDEIISVLEGALNALNSDASEYFEKAGNNPTRAYSQGRLDTYIWVSKCCEQALAKLEKWKQNS